MKKEITKEDIIVGLLVERLSGSDEVKLENYHANNCEGILDDDMPDAFEAWLGNLSLDELVNIIK